MTGGLRLTPVVEVPACEPAAWSWPVAELPAYSWLPLGPHLSPAEVGLVLVALAEAHDVSGTPPDVLAALTEEEQLLLVGGLQLSSAESGGTTISPGCCCDLVDWRAWETLEAGDGTFLGHDPTPWVEDVGDDLLRVWQDRPPKRRRGRGPVPHVDVPRSALPALTAAAREDLLGLLPRLRAWAEEHAPAEAAAFVATYDAAFEITRPRA